MYIGVTNDLLRRIYEHKKRLVEGFTKKYHIHKLVYYEEYEEKQIAMRREWEIKQLSREQKEKLWR